MASNTILNKELFAADTQMFLRTGTPGISVSNTRFQSNLRKGQQIHLPYASTARLQTYTYSTDLTRDQTTFTDDTLTIDQVKAAIVNYDPLQNDLAHQDNWQTMLADEAAYQLSRNINQYVATTGSAGASVTVAGGALSPSTVYDYLTDITTALSRNRAGNGETFGLVEPGFLALLAQNDVANGFMAADEALADGYKGRTKAGVVIYECHDLPCTVTLTVDTQPTAADTFTLYGYTWTCVADAATPTAGQVRIGANLADFQAIFVTLATSATPPSANDYVAHSVDQTRNYLNGQLSATSFSGNVTTITAFGRIGGSETFTAATNVFGSETVTQIFGKMGCIDLVVQENPYVIETQEQLNASKNIISFAQFGAKVFYRNTFRTVKGTMTI